MKKEYDINGNAGQDNAFTEARIEKGDLYPAAREVKHYHYHGGSQHPSLDAQSPLEGAYRLFMIHDSIGVPQLLRQARKHIVLHAAFYPKYGSNDNAGENLWRAMAENQELQLTVIFTDIDHVMWAEEFAHVLRPRFSFEKFKKEFERSKDYFLNDLDPEVSERVHIYNTTRLPMFPVILIDDTLIVGHYAHSSEIAPDGLWLTIQHPRIPAMYDSLLASGKSDCTTAEERSITRYLEELIINP